MKHHSILLISLLILIGTVGLAAAQGNGCPNLVELALTSLGDHCSEMGANSICYGYESLSATFTTDVESGFFTHPSDRADVFILDSIETDPMNLEDGTWGIGVMSLRANIPNTLPGQSIVFLLIGDIQLDNAVDDPATNGLETPVDVVTRIEANLRSKPATTSAVVASFPTGTTLKVDGTSEDQLWLRTTYSNTIAWVNTDVIAPAVVEALPVLRETDRSMMQAFTFSSGIGNPVCGDTAPSMLVVQGPDNITVNITANGVDIEIGSTIGLWMTPENEIRIMVIAGHAVLNGVMVVPAGFTASVKIDENQQAVGTWGGFRAATERELASLAMLQHLPSNVVNYVPVIPTMEQIQQTIQTLEAANQPPEPESPSESGAAGSPGNSDTTSSANGSGNNSNGNNSSPGKGNQGQGKGQDKK